MIPIPILNNNVVVTTSKIVANAGEDITVGSFFNLVAKIGKVEPNVLDNVIVINNVKEVDKAI